MPAKVGTTPIVKAYFGSTSIVRGYVGANMVFDFVVAPVPVNLTPPEVVGVTTVGETLSYANDTWENSPTSFAVHWFRNGFAITNANTPTYTLVEADEGTSISVRVIASNANGDSDPVMSASVGPVEPAAATDPSFAGVKLLIGGDGVDGSTTIIDESPIGRTLTAVGGAQIDTAQSKFGGGSILLNGAGAFVRAADSDDWWFDVGPFTIEGFFRFAATPSNAILLTQWPGGWAWWFQSGKLYLRARVSNGGQADTVGYIWSPVLNQWYHIAIDRTTDGIVRIYVDGVMQAKTTGWTAPFDNSTSNLNIGSLRDGGFTGFDMNGHFDEVRLTKGIARYASDAGFTVPTEAYPRA